MVKVEIVCDYCGRVFQREKSEVNRNKRRGRKNYCSKECKNKAHSLFMLSDKNPTKDNWHKSPSKETRLKISMALKGKRTGEKNPFYGKHHTPETKAKLSKKFKGRKFSIDTRRKISEARKRHKIPLHHTLPELIFERICKKYSLPFRYVGDGSFWIENINPDFIECNGKKIAVEIFGDYWHSPLLNQHIEWNRTYEGRRAILKKYGWDVIIFWESDLKKEGSELFVLRELEKKGIKI